MPKHHAHHLHQLRNSTQDDLGVNKIKRAPGFKYAIIECIDCGAQVGEGCIGPSGSRLGRPHVARQRLAMRKLLEEAGAEA